MKISPYIKNKIKEHASSTDEEVCGFILSDSSGKINILQAKNIADEPCISFCIDPRDYLRAKFSGDIVAIYHSQNSKNPSELDRVNAKIHQYISVVYSKKYDEFTVILLDEQSKYSYYLSRDFQIGKIDCFTLVQDFYKREIGIKIKDYPREEKWFEKNPTLIEDNYRQEGFKRVGDLHLYDLVLLDMNGRGHATHFGIYIGNSCILHHPRYAKSCIELYDRIKRKREKYILRHEKLFNK